MSRSVLPTTKASYLDITQFVLKQHSPLLKPHPIHSPQKTQNQSQPIQLTPELSPILLSTYPLSLTPIFESSKSPIYDLSELDDIQNFEDFTLESNEKMGKGKKIQKQPKSRPRLYSGWLLIENELQNIREEEQMFEENSEDASIDESDEQGENEDEGDISEDEEDMEEESQRLAEENYQRAKVIMNKNEINSFEWENQNPKNKIISELKVIQTSPQPESRQQKLEMIKQKLKYYLLHHEYYCFEDYFSDIQGSTSDIVNHLVRGIEQTFSKTIGGLNFEKRRLKILKYMEKKKGRIWKKKVNYNCRKEVADKRLRIKGKFVTHQQVIEQLGLSNTDGYTADELKMMLLKKVGES